MEFTKKIYSVFFSKQFITFLFIGGLAAIINFASRLLLNKYLSFLYAVTIAYIIGIISAFLLQKAFTFITSEKTSYKQFSYFVIINLIGMAQTIFFSYLFAEILFPKFFMTNYRYELAHFIGLSIPMFSSFIGHKYISFGEYNFLNFIQRLFHRTN